MSINEGTRDDRSSYSKQTTSSVELSRPTTPIDDEEHSRPTTPIDFVTSSVDIERSGLFTLTTSEQQRHETNSIYEKRENQLKDMLIKQGKQVRALYELHKLTNEKLSWIQSQIKKQTKSRDDLNPKVFGVSILISNNIKSVTIDILTIYHSLYTIV